MSRILDPRERTVLIVFSRQRCRPDLAADELRRLRVRLTAAEVAEIVASARRKLEHVAREAARRERSVRKTGKLLPTLPPTAVEEAVMEEHESSVPRPVRSAITGKTLGEALADREEPVGIADRFEREAREEANAVVAELARLRFRADQVIRVLRALHLPVPPEVEWVAAGGDQAMAAMARRASEAMDAEVTRLRGELTARNQEVADLRSALDARRKQDGARIAAERATSAPQGEAPAAPVTGPEEQPAAPEKMTPQERGKAGAAAAAVNRTFLEAGRYRSLEEIEAALHEMERDVTAERLIKEWDLGGRHQAERVIRHFYEAGVLRLQRFPERAESMVFHTGESVFERLPVPAGGWQDMPAWTGSERKSLANEVAARQQAALVAILESVGQPMVPKEVMEEADRLGIGIPQARVADYLRDISRASLILRTGVMRRAASQTAGRTSVEYRALVVPRQPPQEARYEPEPPEQVAPEQLAAVRDVVCSKKESFGVGELVEATELPETTVRAALSDLIKRGVVTYVGFDDLELYEYVKPKGPGRAAELDAKRKRASGANGNGGSTHAGGGVATGRRERCTNKEVEAMLKRAEKSGAEVSKTGSGHFAVRNPQSGRRVIVYGTPGRASLDKNRKKLAGIGIEV